MEPPSNLALVPGHVQAGGPWMTAVVVLAGVSSVTLAALGVAVFLRRRTRSHLLVALTLGGVLSEFDHHVVEHLLDLAMAGLVLAAIYYARSIEREAGVNDP